MICVYAPVTPVLLLGLLLSVPGTAAAAEPQSPTRPPAGGDWPQWRGPERTNIAVGAGLLAEWPKDGPPLAWKAEGLGAGVASVAVAGGRMFALGSRDKSEILTALDAVNGRILWQVPIGPAADENNIMRWLSQRTPTVDGERVYVVAAAGDLVCLATADGKEVWRKNYAKDLGGKRSYWGYCDFPFVDGDRLICTPGGPASTIIALDKVSGGTVWKCAISGIRSGTHSAAVPAEIGGIRQYVHQLDEGVVGIAAADGRLLWRSDAIHTTTGNVHTAIVRDGLVFASGGWGAGCALLKPTPDGDNGFKVEELYRARHPFASWLGSSCLIGDHVYTSNGGCIELKTGNTVWRTPGGVMTAAGDRLYFRLGSGAMVLVEASPGGYSEKGRFMPPRFGKAEPWTFPVIAGGRLFLRDQDGVLCYDLRRERPAGGDRPLPEPARPPDRPAEPKPPAPKPPADRPRPDDAGGDAIFVPTPDDVVARMLELAEVCKDDVVVDLGSGDGRIVIAAARNFGVRAVGVEIDPDLVKLSRKRAAETELVDLVSIREGNLFKTDLTGATVVTLYLGEELNLRLLPQLQKLKPGSRIVSHGFAMKGYKPDRVVRMKSDDDDSEHTIYLWKTPLQKEKP